MHLGSLLSVSEQADTIWDSMRRRSVTDGELECKTATSELSRGINFLAFLKAPVSLLRYGRRQHSHKLINDS